MQISPISSNNQSFGKLYTGYTVGKILEKEGPNSNFAKSVKSIGQTLRREGIHKKENVDVLLQFDEKSSHGFYAVISSKEQGVPMHPMYKHPVSKNKDLLDAIHRWVDAWDMAYKK